MQDSKFIRNVVIGLGVVVVLGIVGLIVAIANRPAAEVYEARIGKAVAAVYGTVKIEWSFTTNVRTQNTGYIQFAPGLLTGQSSIGYTVKKGQLLASIYDEETSKKIRQAKIDLQAAVDRSRLGPMTTQPLRTAQDNMERLKKLKELNNVPEAQFQQAQNEIKRLQDQSSAEQIEINRTVEMLTQNLKNLQEKLGKSEIRAPIDGVLTAINNVDGELVFENNTVFTVAMNSTYVSGQVNEEDVGNLKPWMKAKIKLYSFAGQEFEAVLTSILPSGDTSTNRYSVILNMTRSPENLMAGMTGEMNIILGERDNSLIIPTKALMVDKVFVVDGGVVTPRQVQVGYQGLEELEILKGLKEGDLVIVADQDLFSPGERVRPMIINKNAEEKK